ncbi:hypothetical protein ABIB06_007368 [Bradyrhizobium sp. LB8.2]|uniref:hypothetical protein n=1 Tax=unclassified Bradyrhizobium TaxID=2631580 RepID=UPI0033919204
MRELSPYLSIAGLAHRHASELKRVIADDPHQFPRGDQPLDSSEIACCDAILAVVQSVLAVHLRVLGFSDDGKAIASIPQAVLDLLDEEDSPIYEA